MIGGNFAETDHKQANGAVYQATPSVNYPPIALQLNKIHSYLVYLFQYTNEHILFPTY